MQCAIYKSRRADTYLYVAVRDGYRIPGVAADRRTGACHGSGVAGTKAGAGGYGGGAAKSGGARLAFADAAQ